MILKDHDQIQLVCDTCSAETPVYDEDEFNAMIAPACQGFLTSEGRFVNRVQAMQIAHIAGQEQLRPLGDRHQRDLFSEDLW